MRIGINLFKLFNCIFFIFMIVLLKLNNYNSVYFITLFFCILNSLISNNQKITISLELFFIQIISNFQLEKINFAYAMDKIGNSLLNNILFGLVINIFITIFCFIFMIIKNKNKFLKIYFLISIFLQLVVILLIIYIYIFPIKINIVNIFLNVFFVFSYIFVYFMIDIIFLCIFFLSIGKKYTISKYSLVLFCIFSIVLRCNLLYF